MENLVLNFLYTHSLQSIKVIEEENKLLSKVFENDQLTKAILNNNNQLNTLLNKIKDETLTVTQYKQVCQDEIIFNTSVLNDAKELFKSYNANIEFIISARIMNYKADISLCDSLYFNTKIYSEHYDKKYFSYEHHLPLQILEFELSQINQAIEEQQQVEYFKFKKSKLEKAIYLIENSTDSLLYDIPKLQEMYSSLLLSIQLDTNCSINVKDNIAARINFILNYLEDMKETVDCKESKLEINNTTKTSSSTKVTHQSKYFFLKKNISEYKAAYTYLTEINSEKSIITECKNNIFILERLMEEYNQSKSIKNMNLLPEAITSEFICNQKDKDRDDIYDMLINNYIKLQAYQRETMTIKSKYSEYSDAIINQKFETYEKIISLLQKSKQCLFTPTPLYEDELIDVYDEVIQHDLKENQVLIKFYHPEPYMDCKFEFSIDNINYLFKFDSNSNSNETQKIITLSENEYKQLHHNKIKIIIHKTFAICCKSSSFYFLIDLSDLQKHSKVIKEAIIHDDNNKSICCFAKFEVSIRKSLIEKECNLVEKSFLNITKFNPTFIINEEFKNENEDKIITQKEIYNLEILRAFFIPKKNLNLNEIIKDRVLTEVNDNDIKLIEKVKMSTTQIFHINLFSTDELENPFDLCNYATIRTIENRLLYLKEDYFSHENIDLLKRKEILNFKQKLKEIKSSLNKGEIKLKDYIDIIKERTKKDMLIISYYETKENDQIIQDLKSRIILLNKELEECKHLQ